MSCTSRSENRFTGLLQQRGDRGVARRERGRVAVRAADVAEQLLPLVIDVAPPGVSVEGAGGARKRMKFEKFWIAIVASSAVVASVF